MYNKFNKFHFRMAQHTTVVATAWAHCVTRKFIALIGMSDQSFRIYITQYTQVNVLTPFARITYQLRWKKKYLIYRPRYSDKI